MIRLFGFLTGVAVTGTALLLFTDETAFESARAAVSQIADRAGVRTAVEAEAQSFAATPRPDALRAGPGWADLANAPLEDAADAAGTPPDGGDSREGDASAVPAGPEQPLAADTGAAGSQTPTPPHREGAAQPPTPAGDEPAPSSAQEPVDAVAPPLPARAMQAGPNPVGADETEADLSSEGPPAVPAAAPAQPAGTPAASGEEMQGHWYAFWTPFRSRASAQGFASHLGTATGEEIRVLRMGPGEYRVAFFHSGEDERRDRLAVLEQASGLTLGGEL